MSITKQGVIVSKSELIPSNILVNSSFTKDFNSWSKQSTGWEITTKDGYKCAHVSGAMTTTYYVGQSVLGGLNTSDLSTIYTISGDIKLENYVRGTTNPMCEFYFGGSYNNNETSTWMGATLVTTNNYYFQGMNNLGWFHASAQVRFTQVPTNMWFYIYFRDGTGDLYFRNLKFEKGTVGTIYIPSTSEVGFPSNYHGFIENDDIARIVNTHIEAVQFYEI